ncbi:MULTISPECIES: MgtC/SapB family protein [Arenibacter]|uniref:MgtC/SapB family protein n=1 Tax=Arenibacter TaxID=178469 RepID=UPI0004DF0F47|nr:MULTISPECIES: MgtC/SapB family protein [Arenibacter]GBF20491.1 mgtC family protein [Arenibacter sp. NBRC 103722]|tara:strand:+ start:7805 stop:9070 length:1266 start_codon:yes stop_codon:yes gene_type:complete
MDYHDLTTLGIAFGLGLLVGLQREKANSELAGVRTFTLIAILGVLAGFLSRDYQNPFILPVLGVALTSLLVAANFIKIKVFTNPDVGQTTEVAALLMFAIGAYLVMGDRVLGIVIGVSMSVLLYVKERLHGFINRLQEKDLSAIMTFAGISLVVLPILPNKTYGPYNVLNPQNIWLMITLIVGLSVLGYFIYKFVGKKLGIISNGVLGGLISSTATTVSYARKTVDTASISKMAAFVITVASAISLARVMVEIGVVIPEKLPVILLPLMVEFVVMALICLGMFYSINKDSKDDTMPEPENPAEFKSALVFGLLYGAILLAVAFANEEFGDDALYIVAIISGLTDVDAITLSLSQLIKIDALNVSTGWKLILLASLSNLVFKGVMAGILGTKQLAKWIALSFGIAIIVGIFLIWLWPASWHL